MDNPKICNSKTCNVQNLQCELSSELDPVCFLFFFCDTYNIIQRFFPTDLLSALCKLVKIGISYYVSFNSFKRQRLCIFECVFRDTYIIQRFFPTYSFTALCKLVKIGISYL